jgi:DNA-binding transcriptional ArsR family regulator
MPRAASTSDVFNAIAETKRREIVTLLSNGQPLSVGAIVHKLQLAQPAVSKHLGVLREVGLVEVDRQGQQRLYRLNPAELKPVRDWVRDCEQLWDRKISRIKEAAERKARETSTKPRTNKKSR